MVRVRRLSTWILVFLIQFLLLAIFIAKTGLYRPRKTLDMINDDPILNEPDSGKLVVEQKEVIVKDSPPTEHENSATARTTVSPYDTDIVIGIPSIKRPQGKVYLDETLKYLIERMGKVERAVFLVYLAEQDIEWTDQMINLLKHTFPDEVSKNTIRIITPPATIYPDWEKDLKLTLGDPFHQVKWRSKQNLDAAYLMEYAYTLNPKYYLGIEDDVKAADNYLEKIIEHANQEWKDGIIFASYCAQGAIGKLFFNKDILTVSTYLKTFWNYKPLDWLYWDLKSLVACGYPRTDCEKKANAAVIEYNTPLFSHKGKVSSLEKKKP